VNKVFKYAGIIVNNSSIQVDKIFTYAVPSKYTDIMQVGYRVTVPFGFGNKKIYGFVISLFNDFEGASNIKEISSICDDYPILREQDIKLIHFMKERYLCTYLECIKAILPSGITKDISEKTSNVIFVSKALEGKYNKEPYLTIYNTVRLHNGKMNKNELSKAFEISLSSINTLLKYGFLAYEEQVVHRYDKREYSTYLRKTLNQEQQHAVDAIKNLQKDIFLIHGVTGSGKTEIYMNLVDEMIKANRDSIILVPEISLTPQMVERFKGRFGRDVTVFHSKLSEGERYDEWLRVKSGKVKLAIGARSAIFLPFNNLGLIVIDEEHESSYKSDSDPKYRAAEIAEFKCRAEGAKLVLGSATPSIETYYRASELKEIGLITIKNRADNAILPEIYVVDMREELEANNKSIFSKQLYHEMQGCLERKEQVILFLNRRGHSPFVSCRKCGFVFKCDHCDISLTYHHEDNALHCHYCGRKRRMSNICPRCKSKYVKHFGIGTEKIELEVKRYFKGARTIRMDFDTTRKKHAYENIYNSFKNNEADVLIGTQMIAKGLDFKNVTLVGVMAADLSLNLPDFRSAERTFQLITQVSGRAGRGEKKGKVVVQTYSPDNYSIESSINNDYLGFFKEELSIRKDMNYPPFSKILAINMSSKNEELLIKNIQNVGVVLKNLLYNGSRVEMLGPCPCAISKIKEQYRWQIVLKGEIGFDLANKIRDTIYELLKEVYTEIRLSLDINPTSLL